MNKFLLKICLGVIILSAVMLTAAPERTYGAIDGFTGTTFNLTAREHYISTPDGGVIFMWGYANAGSLPQYPGPTLIVNEGDTITINLTNTLSVNTSIIFPGQSVTTTGGQPGLLTAEAASSGGTVTYTFTADHPGTYTYYSGTRQELQIEMGLSLIHI